MDLKRKRDVTLSGALLRGARWIAWSRRSKVVYAWSYCHVIFLYLNRSTWIESRSARRLNSQQIMQWVMIWTSFVTYRLSIVCRISFELNLRREVPFILVLIEESSISSVSCTDMYPMTKGWIEDSESRYRIKYGREKKRCILMWETKIWNTLIN